MGLDDVQVILEGYLRIGHHPRRKNGMGFSTTCAFDAKKLDFLRGHT